MQVEIVTPEGRAFKSDSAVEFTAPGINGEFGVLPGHTLYLTLIKAGEVTCKDAAGEHRFVVADGFIDVVDDTVRVMVEYAESAGEIDMHKAREELAAAEAALSGKSAFDDDFDVMEAQLQRAMAKVSARR